MGFIWLIFWLFLYQQPEKQRRLSFAELAYIREDDQKEITTVPAEKVSWTRLLAYKQPWAFTIGKFMTDGVWCFFLFCMTDYLMQYGIINASAVTTGGGVYDEQCWAVSAADGSLMFSLRRDILFMIKNESNVIDRIFPLAVLLAQLCVISAIVLVLLIGLVCRPTGLVCQYIQYGF
jgi:ACS family hexuronate transporter-like MFS transporter